ncbi:MAG: hypothetical protein ACXVPY_14195 [Bacteroidia bacterium]
MRFALLFILSWLTISTIAQTEIKLGDVQNHIGDSVRLQAKIYGGKYLKPAKGSPTFLDVGGNYPNAPLTLVIWNDVRKQFQEPPENAFKGRQMFITGKFLYKDKPEIVINSPEQLVQVAGAPIEK